MRASPEVPLVTALSVAGGVGPVWTAPVNGVREQVVSRGWLLSLGMLFSRPIHIG